MRCSAHSNLDARTRLMVQLAAMIACQALREYRVMLGAALAVGVTPVEIKEIVYQAVPYVGMAKVFDFIHATNEALTERGVSLPVAGPVDDHARDPGREGPRGPEADRRRRCRREALRLGAGRRAAYPALSCRPTASATTTRAPASTSPRASFSPSACSLRSADAIPRSRAMSPPTSTSATTARD